MVRSPQLVAHFVGPLCPQTRGQSGDKMEDSGRWNRLQHARKFFKLAASLADVPRSMRVRSFLLILIACAMGPWMLWSGAKDYRNNQRLAAEGKAATAQVLDRTVKTRSRGADQFYLTVQFEAETGQPM